MRPLVKFKYRSFRNSVCQEFALLARNAAEAIDLAQIRLSAELSAPDKPDRSVVLDPRSNTLATFVVTEKGEIQIVPTATAA